MTGSRLVLASGSPRRRDLLGRLEIDFEVHPADIDESPRPDERPAAHVARLAVEKAEFVRDRLADPDARVLAADTIVVVDDEILGKPVDVDDARRMLRRLSDHSHEVLTGVALAATGRTTRHLVERTVVGFVELDEERIEAYLATGEPFDKAGAYAIQGGAGGFVNRIDGSFDNVVGLPMHRVTDLLGG